MTILYSSSSSKGLRNIARFYTNTNTATYSDADLDAAINRYYHLFATEIIDAMDGWDFSGDVATADLVNGQQEYTFPSDLLKIKRIEVTYDGSSWRKVNFMDINEKASPTDTTSISQNFSKEAPYADIMDTGIFLYPIPSANVSGGLKIWYEKDITELSAVSDQPNILEAFQPGLAYGAAVDYLVKYIEKDSNQARLQVVQPIYLDCINKMRRFYRSRVQDQEYSVQGQYVDYDYGNEY